jgi:hypothetical protein
MMLFKFNVIAPPWLDDFLGALRPEAHTTQVEVG